MKLNIYWIRKWEMKKTEVKWNEMTEQDAHGFVLSFAIEQTMGKYMVLTGKIEEVKKAKVYHSAATPHKIIHSLHIISWQTKGTKRKQTNGEDKKRTENTHASR